MRVSVPCDTPLPLLYRATVSGLTPANTASSICLSRSTLRNLRNCALRFLSGFTCGTAFYSNHNPIEEIDGEDFASSDFGLKSQSSR